METNKGRTGKKPPKATLIAGAVIAAVTLAALYYMLFPPAKSTAGLPIAIIWLDGEEYMRIPLDPDAPDQTINLEDQGKPVILEIKEGKIRFAQVTCPDQICVNTGFISIDGQTAICMPNRTAVTVTIE